MLTFPPDITFVIQIVSFLILWFGLKHLLFDPFVRVLEEREARTTGARREAGAMKVSAEQAAADYERRMAEVRRAAAADAEAARSATQAAERQLLEEARAEAALQLAQLRASLDRQADAARGALEAEARDLSARIVERVVERPRA